MDPIVAHYIIDGITIVASALIAYFVARLRSKSQNKLDDANAANAISETWQRLNKPLSDRVEKLEHEIVERDALIEDLRDWIERLIKQIKRRGDEPVKFIPRKSHLTTEE